MSRQLLKISIPLWKMKYCSIIIDAKVTIKT